MPKDKLRLYIPKMKHATKYHPMMCEQIIEIAEQGGHVAHMCDAIGVASFETFYRWLKEYPEFQEAYTTAKMKSQIFYENILLAGALGKIKNYNFNSMAMIMNNKFSDDYKRGTGTSSNTEINIGVLQNIEKLTALELDEKIKSLADKVKLTHIDDGEIIDADL